MDPIDDFHRSTDGDVGKWGPDPVGYGRLLRAQGNRTLRFGGASDFFGRLGSGLVDQPFMSSASERQPLAFNFDRSSAMWGVPGLLVTALCLNMAALKMPFLEIRVFPSATENYSIPHTISLMWSESLYLVAILIAAFSLVFPFIKISLLAAAWYAPIRHRTRGRLLALLGGLGKWSLLDVFVALVLIVLAHDQGSLFVTGVRPGLGLFLAAIILAMVSGDLMHRLHDGLEIQEETQPPAALRHRWWVHLVPVLAAGALISFIAAIASPYLKITAWYLTDRQYSIIDTVGTLFGDRNFIFGFVVVSFLVITPALRIVWIFLAWSQRNHPARLRRLIASLDILQRWAMLDVFGLAIGLFLLEGSNLVPIEHQSGVWLIVVAVGLNMVMARSARLLVSWAALRGNDVVVAPDKA